MTYQHDTRTFPSTYGESLRRKPIAAYQFKGGSCLNELGHPRPVLHSDGGTGRARFDVAFDALAHPGNVHGAL